MTLDKEDIAAICDAMVPRLLEAIRDSNYPQPERDEFMVVLSTQGPIAAQLWQKNKMKRRI
jgi:hypothetical protein